MAVNKDLAETKWKYRHYTDFYFECLKPGHDVRIFEGSGYSWSAYCVECDKVWKLVFGEHTRLLCVSSEGLPPGAKAECDKLKARIGAGVGHE